MAYTPVSFVADEILTSTKMNQLAANDASFNDGTGIGNGTILPSKLNDDVYYCDYENYQGITTNSFVAPSSGFVTVHGSVASNQYDSYCVAQIEGRNCFYLHNAISGLQGYNLQSAGQFYVSKGQTVTFEVHNGAGWLQRAFMPLKRS